MKLSPRFSHDDWNAAFDGTNVDWDRAIAVAEDRVRGRWLDWADKIVDSRYSGFAVLTLDCVVLESLWGFMNGIAIPQGKERDVYRDVLGSPRFAWPTAQVDAFRKFVRNGLMHDAETRNHWVLEMTVPRSVIIEQQPTGGYVLNRTLFHNALKGTVGDWLSKLRGGDAALRQNLKRRMNGIIRAHYSS